MTRIPVGDTISRTYGFAFSNLLSIIGIAWLPYVALGAIAFGLVFLLAPELPRMLLQGQFDPVMFMHVGRIFGLLGLLLFIVGCMVTVGIQRKALGRHPGPVFFYFSLGAAVWRMAGALFLAWLVIFFVGLLTAGVAAAIWYAAGRFVPDYETPVRVVACIVAVLWFIYLCVRLTFFLPAVVVAEERIGLGRAWELGGGNFWRIFIVAVAVFVPVVIASGILFAAVLGPMFIMPHWHAGMDIRELIREAVRQSLVLSPVGIVLRIVERIVLLALGNGAIANSYLALTGGPGSAAPASAPEPG